MDVCWGAGSFHVPHVAFRVENECSRFLVVKVKYVRMLGGALVGTIVRDAAPTTSRCSWICCNCVRIP